MKFCSECFNDSEIKGIIDSINNEDECDILRIKSEHIYDTEKHSDLIPYFENFISMYTPVSDSIPCDKSDILHMKYEILENWDIFKANISHNNVYNIIKNICIDKYQESPDLFDSGIVIKENYDTEYKKHHSLLKNDNWDDFTKSIIRHNRFHSKHFNEKLLNYFCSKVSKEYKAGTIFYRGRISPKDGYKESDMGAPDIALSVEGRVNATGEECLYLASEIETTINEVRAGVSDYITIGDFQLQKDINIVDLKNIHNISPFRLDDEDIPLVDFAINKKHLYRINKEMGKVIRKSDSRLDYIPTQYISDCIKSFELNHSAIYAGVEYNSTLCSKGYNIACFYPELFKCIKVSVYEVDSLNYNFKLL